MAESEFLNADDKPVLTAIESEDIRAKVDATLQELGYVVHNVESHDAFPSQFAQIQYEVMILEDNKTLETVQEMPMSLRRHCTFLLISSAFETMHPMQGWGQSVHAVVNPSDMENIKAILQKVIADNETFMRTFFDVQKKLAES
ncbi:MAG: hypothetical protein ACKVJX_01310 [Verrucomicrobiia bacterium]|jgi:DNA-binding response OmpR family regulator